MKNGTDRGNREIELQVPLMIPGASGDPVARLDAHVAQGVRQSMDALLQLPVVRSVHAAVAAPANDLFLSEELAGPTENAGNHQRPVHHESLHRELPVPSMVAFGSIGDA